jgi:hypothetical protein
LLLETLVDSERSVCEKAMGALDGIYNREKRREKVWRFLNLAICKETRAFIFASTLYLFAHKRQPKSKEDLSHSTISLSCFNIWWKIEKKGERKREGKNTLR